MKGFIRMKYAPIVEFVVLVTSFTVFRVLGWISQSAFVTGLFLFALWAVVGIPLTLAVGRDDRVRTAHYLRGVYHVITLVALILVLQHILVDWMSLWELYFTVIRSTVMWVLLASLSVEFLHNVYLSIT